MDQQRLNDMLVTFSRYNQLTVVKKLLKLGANIHDYNDYVLRLALYQRRYETVAFLLENGADPKSCFSFPFSPPFLE